MPETADNKCRVMNENDGERQQLLWFKEQQRRPGAIIAFGAWPSGCVRIRILWRRLGPRSSQEEGAMPLMDKDLLTMSRTKTWTHCCVKARVPAQRRWTPLLVNQGNKHSDVNNEANQSFIVLVWVRMRGEVWGFKRLPTTPQDLNDHTARGNRAGTNQCDTRHRSDLALKRLACDRKRGLEREREVLSVPRGEDKSS